MLINGTVHIIMTGGVNPFGHSDSAVLRINTAVMLVIDPNVHAHGQQNIVGGLSMVPRANVIHHGEVSINDPSNP